MCKFDFELINDMEEYYAMKKPIYFCVCEFIYIKINYNPKTIWHNWLVSKYYVLIDKLEQRSE